MKGCVSAGQKVIRIWPSNDVPRNEWKSTTSKSKVLQVPSISTRLVATPELTNSDPVGGGGGYLPEGLQCPNPLDWRRKPT